MNQKLENGWQHEEVALFRKGHRSWQL